MNNLVKYESVVYFADTYLSDLSKQIRNYQQDGYYIISMNRENDKHFVYMGRPHKDEILKLS